MGDSDSSHISACGQYSCFNPFLFKVKINKQAKILGDQKAASLKQNPAVTLRQPSMPLTQGIPLPRAYLGTRRAVALLSVCSAILAVRFHLNDLRVAATPSSSLPAFQTEQDKRAEGEGCMSIVSLLKTFPSNWRFRFTEQRPVRCASQFPRKSEDRESFFSTG